MHTLCALCEADAWDRELYPDTLGEQAATVELFSARRTPDRTHYRIVRCGRCGLVRSDPIVPEGELARLYAGSRVTYEREAPYAAATYLRYLQDCLPLAPDRHRLLEIGCGNGFFLGHAARCGFAEVHGVEPSRQAVESATEAVRGRIRNDTFQEGLFPENHFSVICGFQVLDHLAHPNAVLQTCLRLLKPGGLALFINHDVGAWTTRCLRERSPVFDVEHVYLYDRRTMSRLFRKNGFEQVRVFGVRNVYPLYYWCKMAPAPRAVKARLTDWLDRSRLGRIGVGLRAGNLGLVARKPRTAGQTAGG